jgi:hypothetical protein
VQGIGVKLVDPPPSSLTSPLARSYITGSLTGGQSLRSKVEISNTTRKTQTISIYTAGARMRGGVFSFANGRAKNELSRWTTVSNRLVRLASGRATIVTVSVKVPREVSRGERYSVVWAAVDAPGTHTSVRLVHRVGLRMYLSIGGTAPPRYTVSRPRASRSSTGAPLVTATIRNGGVGTIAISGGAMTLAGGPGGLRAGPFPIVVALPLGPHSSTGVTVRLTSQLPRGPWSARLTIRSGSTQRSAVARITFPVLARSQVASEPPDAGGLRARFAGRRAGS